MMHNWNVALSGLGLQVLLYIQQPDNQYGLMNPSICHCLHDDVSTPYRSTTTMMAWMRAHSMSTRH